MTAKKTTEAVEATVAENAKVEANAICVGYVPEELRTKLETVAGKMLDQLIGYNGEFNASQLNSLNAVMDIYRTIRY